MKRLLLLLGLSWVGVSAGRAGVGPGVAGELSITSPLMGAGQVAPVYRPAYSPPVITVAPKLFNPPGPVYSVPARPHVVAPLPGEDSHAPVAVTVGPILHPEASAHLRQAPISTLKPPPLPTHPEHGLRNWLHRHRFRFHAKQR